MSDALKRLKAIVDRLRGPDGCPWDREQTPQSLKPYLLEEAHEVAEAIEGSDPAALREELGDLLLNIFLQARIGEEENQFSLEEVADGISDKLVRRHPHVFGDGDASDSAAGRRSWEEIKQREKPESVDEGILRRLPASLPALSRGQRLGAMAAEFGFDWADAQGPLGKIEEEVEELRRAVDGGATEAIETEIGDLLLAITSLCRHTAVDAEAALGRALQKFRRRFRHIETTLGPGSGASLERMEELWQEAKRGE